MTIPFMVGRKIYGRGLQRNDLPAMVEWINDHEVTRLLFMGSRPVTIESLEKEWERDQHDASVVTLAVCARENDEFIGTTGLYVINWIMRSAEFRIFLGNKKYWNRGIGTECTKLMAVYGFEKLNLNRIWLGVNADNIGGVRAYEKAGFAREGVLRQEQYRNFRYYDAIRMSMLRSEYEALREGYLERELEVR